MSMRTIARSSSNRTSASALASSVLPTPVGPRKRNEPVGRFGSATPERARRPAAAKARPAAGRAATGAPRVGRADAPGGGLVLHPQQLLRLPLQQPAGGDPGPGLHHLG